MRYMSLLMRLAVVTLPLILSLSSAAHAENSCSSVLSKRPPVARSLRPLLDRIWNDRLQQDPLYSRPRVQRYMQIIEKAFANPSQGTFADGRPRGTIMIEPEKGTRDLEVMGCSFRVQQDGTLNIGFVSVRVVTSSELGRAADSETEYGERPQGSSMMMVDLVAAVLGSARRYAATHSNINGVLIRAQSVQSPSLTKMLLDSGFEPAPVETNLGGSYFLKFEIPKEADLK